jgi:hypothetical protein
MKKVGSKRLNSRFFPEKLRELIEKGEENLPVRRPYIRAVVGAVHITRSPRVADTLEECVRTATEHGMIVLEVKSNQIVFLANYFENANWPLNLILFFERLTKRTDGKATLSCSASMGPGIFRLNSESVELQSDDGRLALELARQAPDGQMIITSKIWHALADSLEGWQQEAQSHTVDGIGIAIPCVHLRPRLKGKKCAGCGTSLEIRQTNDGYIFVACKNGHVQNDDYDGPPSVPMRRTA